MRATSPSPSCSQAPTGAPTTSPRKPWLLPSQDFDAPSEEGAAISGTLQLGGKIWSLRSSDDVPFELMRRLMGTAPPEEGTDEDPATTAARTRESVMQTGPFFEATIVPEQVDDFMEMFTSPKSPVTLGKLKTLMEYVSTCIFNTEGAERPTQPSRSSSPGRSRTGRTSKATSSSTGTPRAASGS